MADNYIATVKKMRGGRDDFFMKDIKEILSQYAKMELQVETIDKDKIDEDVCGEAE